jgi:hypothetical protein
MNHEDDALAPARGVCVGLLLAIMFWGLALALAYSW